MSDYVCIDVDKVVRITEKAMLIELWGEEIWIPLSQIAREDVDQYEEGDLNCSMSITSWIAKQKQIENLGK